MKKFYLSLSISLLSGLCLAQKESETTQPRKPVYADFAYATPARDTLYLSSDDSLSRNIFMSWHMDPRWNGTNPTIVFMPQEFIDRRKTLEDLGSTTTTRAKKMKKGK